MTNELKKILLRATSYCNFWKVLSGKDFLPISEELTKAINCAEADSELKKILLQAKACCNVSNNRTNRTNRTNRNEDSSRRAKAFILIHKKLREAIKLIDEINPVTEVQ